MASSPNPQSNAGDEPFPGWAAVAAGVAVFVMPIISLIVSLVMRSSEQRPSRRSFLKNWAIASGVWLCTGWILVLVAFLAISSGSSASGACRGGPDPFNPPSYESQDGKHWTAIIPCRDGGSKTRPAHKGEVPGG